MQNELVKLGEVFKNRREERRLSIKEVENATSIRAGYLEAIEEGHIGKLISPVYAQGFINKYATFLDIDSERLMSDHPYVSKILTENHAQSDEFLTGLGSLEMRSSPGSQLKWLPNLLWVGLSVAGILGLWFGARYLGLF